MRKNVLSALSIVLLALPQIAKAQAEKKQHEYSLNVGSASLYQITQNLLSSEFYYSTGIYGLSIRYYVGRTVTLGGNISFEQIHLKRWPNTEQLLTLAPELTVTYWERKKPANSKQFGARVYGLAAAGVVANHDLDYNSTKFTPNIHVSLAGVRVGNQLALFAEVGMGYRGLLNCGLSYRPSLKKNKVVK